MSLHLVVCGTGEPGSEWLLKLLYLLGFAYTCKDCACCAAKDKDQRTPKTMGDIYTWLLSYSLVCGRHIQHLSGEGGPVHG